MDTGPRWLAVVTAALLLTACGSEDRGTPPDSGSPIDAGDDSGNPSDLSCLNMVPLRLWTTDPSAVAMLYRIETCAGETVVLYPREGESVFDYYSLTENGSPLSSEASPAVDRSGAQRAYVNLLLDFSGSTRPITADLLASARAFVEALLAESDRVWIGIEIFDGRSNVVTIQRPTPDLAELQAALAGLATYDDPLADVAATNLHGAIAGSVENLQRWQGRIVSRNGDGIATSGYVVAFTDGRDTADRVSVDVAAASVAQARTAVGTEDLANVQTYAVALQGADYTPEARSSLLQVLGGEQRYLYEGSLSDLSARFRGLARRIAEQTSATHLLKYCSAARSGMRTVELGVLPSRGNARNTISFRFTADGFAPGCGAFLGTTCGERECGGFNCGACDDRSETCDIPAGRCVNDCVGAGLCSGESLTNDLGYELTCGGGFISSCAGSCIDTSGDPVNCGSCGNVCAPGSTCELGACRAPTPPDGGVPMTDGGVPGMDGGVVAFDGAAPGMDGGVIAMDGGVEPGDMGASPSDLGAVTDAGFSPEMGSGGDMGIAMDMSISPDMGGTVPICGNGVRDIGEKCDRTPGCGCTPAAASCVEADCDTLPACGNGTVDVGEQCDPAPAMSPPGSWDADGCQSDCFKQQSLIVNSLSIDRAMGCDYSGDGVPDNSFGAAYGTALGFLNGQLDDALSNGQAILLLSMVGLDNPMSDTGVRVGWITGRDGDMNAMNNFSGSANFFADADAIGRDGDPVTSFSSTIAGERLSGGPDDVILPIAGLFPLDLRQARISGTVTSSGSDVTGIAAGLICGAIPVSSVANQPNTLGMVGGMVPVPCDPSVVETTLGDVLVGGASIFGITLGPAQPDVDLDGDGLERYEVDSTGPFGCQAVISACIDGDGTRIPGHACTGDARMADGFSAGLPFTAVGANIIGVR
jgi:hypothetical protein